MNSSSAPLVLFSAATGSRVDRKNGILKGVSVITKGEAKGHDMVIDDLCLSQVMACAQTYEDGLRVKMDHGTGIDALVGTLQNFSLDGDKVRADLQLIKSHDDFEKILEMAETIPGSFGLSITFSGTPEEVQWPVALDEGDEMSDSQSEEDDDDQGEDENPVTAPSEDDITPTNDGVLPDDIMASSEPATEARMAARCMEIYSCDIVDMPAANPSGLFHEKRHEHHDTKLAPDPVATPETPAGDAAPSPDNGAPSDEDQTPAPETPVDVAPDPGNDSMPTTVEEPAADDGQIPSDEQLPSDDPPAVIPEEEVSQEITATPLEAIVEDVVTFAARTGEFEAQIISLKADIEARTTELAAKEARITELSAKLASAEASVVERDARLAEEAARIASLSELHIKLKKSMGLLPAVNVPEVAFADEIKRPVDYRREYAAIKDPSERARYFAANFGKLVD
jgi:hypothetical protein